MYSSKSCIVNKRRLKFKKNGREWYLIQWRRKMFINGGDPILRTQNSISSTKTIL